MGRFLQWPSRIYHRAVWPTTEELMKKTTRAREGRRNDLLNTHALWSSDRVRPLVWGPVVALTEQETAVKITACEVLPPTPATAGVSRMEG